MKAPWSASGTPNPAHHTWAAELNPNSATRADQALFTARIDVLDAPSFKRQVLNIAKTGPPPSVRIVVVPFQKFSNRGREGVIREVFGRA